MSQSNATERIQQGSLLKPRAEPQVRPTVDHFQIHSASDEELLVALRERNQESLAELFRRHSRLVFSISLRILRNTSEAEEVVQEVFLFLFQRAELFDKRKGGGKAWLVQIAYHRSLDRMEYLRRRNAYFGTDSEFLAETIVGKGDVERDFASKQKRELLKKAFEQLTDRQTSHSGAILL